LVNHTDHEYTRPEQARPNKAYHGLYDLWGLPLWNFNILSRQSCPM
jgi:hypothetical protein